MRSVQLPAKSQSAATVLLGAARCWRRARDAAAPIQPALSCELASRDCVVLAPVLDSLMRFYEAALGRPMATGDGNRPSEDEMTLIGLLDGGRTRACLGCPERAARALDCALCSTRIMLALACPPTLGALQ